MSIKLAKILDAEIISADSMQIYKGMDIGTAKITEEEKQGIKHHLINIKNSDEEYSLAEYLSDVKKTIEDIQKRGKRAIIVGGTGLYINGIIYGLDMQKTVDLNYRKELEEKIKKDPAFLDELYDQAKKIDPKSIEKISKTDEKRIIRILEIYKVTGKTKEQIDQEQIKDKDSENENNKYILFVLNRDRQRLYTRINKRVDEMIDQGLVHEVKGLNLSKTSSQAIGYKEIKEYLDGKIDYEKCVELIKQRSRNYAKRQLTWFRKNEAIWIDVDKDDALEVVLKNIEKSVKGE